MDDFYDDIQSSSDEINNLVPAVLLLASIYSQQQRYRPSNRLYTGQEYIDNLLNCNNDSFEDMV